MVFSFLEKSKLAFVYFGKRLTEKKEGEKLSAMEPKVCTQLVSVTIHDYFQRIPAHKINLTRNWDHVSSCIICLLSSLVDF